MWGYPCNANAGKKEEEFSSKISLKMASNLIDMIKSVLGMKQDDTSDSAIAGIFKNLFKNKMKRVKKDKQNVLSQNKQNDE